MNERSVSSANFFPHSISTHGLSYLAKKYKIITLRFLSSHLGLSFYSSSWFNCTVSLNILYRGNLTRIFIFELLIFYDYMNTIHEIMGTLL